MLTGACVGLAACVLIGSGGLVQQNVGTGLELRVIAAVVIGGTLLVGGRGYLIGSVLGVLVLGLIQTIITFEGTLSSWWTRIVIGVLLLIFVVLQRLLTYRRT